MNFCVLIISFYSFHLIEKIIKNFNKNTDIIIIENSRDFNLKENIEKNYSNTKVIIPDKNLGWGSAVNLGLSLSNQNLVLCINPDVTFNEETIKSISLFSEKFQDFVIFSPTYINDKIYKNYDTYFPKTNFKGQIFEKYEIIKVDYVDGQFILINKNKLQKIGLMDENIFLHFETRDLCKRIVDNNENVIVSKLIKYDHFGKESTHSSAIDDSEPLRNWHYCWSKFYFYRKHFSYLYALKKTLPNLLRSIKNCLFSIITYNKKKFILNKYELTGLFNSYLLRKSYLRPKIKKKP